MATYVPPKKNTAYRFWVSLSAQSQSNTFQSNPTLAAGDVKVSIDGAALANLATLPVVTPAGSKLVQIDLSAAEMNGDNITVIFSDAAGAEWKDLVVSIQTTARQIDDLAYPATSGRSMTVDAAGLVDANVVKVGPSGSGTPQTARDLGANLDAAVSSRLATSSYTAPLDAASTRNAVGLAAANLDAQLAEIEAETDDIAAVKAQTDKLTFTVANKVDANMKDVNDIGVKGSGTINDPWGPV